MMKTMKLVMGVVLIVLAGCDGDKEAEALLDKAHKISSPKEKFPDEDHTEFMHEAFVTLGAFEARISAYNFLEIQIGLMNSSRLILDLDKSAESVANALEAKDAGQRALDKYNECESAAERSLIDLRNSAKGNAFREAVLERMEKVHTQLVLEQTLRDEKRSAKDSGKLAGLEATIKTANDEREKLQEMIDDLDNYIFQWNLNHRRK